MTTFRYLCILAVVGAPLLAACGRGAPLPTPRSVIVYTGARVQADAERMEEVDQWLRRQTDHIDRSRGFTIRVLRRETAAYPWDDLEISGDTARVFVQHLARDAETPYMLYAHFHLMSRQGRLQDWLPEAPDAEGFELERAVLKRIADVWLYGRSVFDTQPFGPLDELLYASEHGFLDEFILATQTDRFEDRKVAYYEENPERQEAFRRWFLDTFEREGPGYVEANDEAADTVDRPES
jgi:hypothetical protein